MAFKLTLIEWQLQHFVDAFEGKNKHLIKFNTKLKKLISMKYFSPRIIFNGAQLNKLFWCSLYL